MKTTSAIFTFLLSIQATTAFITSYQRQPSFGIRSAESSPVRLYATTSSKATIRPDTSAAVEEALKVTASFGIDSKEAAAAWDIVEEMDASDNSAATKGSLAEECDIESVSEQCKQYGDFLSELVTLRDALAQSDVDKKKASLFDTLKMIKLTKPQSATATSSPELTAALEAAKLATESHGITSTEAKLAWETYEEIAASGNQNAVGINLMEECGIESGQDACRAMEELERVMPVLLALSAK